jgi:hypothetical protein
MNLSNRSLEILRNFSSINPSLLFEEGSTLRTISPTKTVLARANIENSIESTFAIYDLSRFLGVVSLFDNTPDLEIEEKKLNIMAAGRRVSYTFADPSTIVTPPNKEIQLPSPEVSFTMTSSMLSEITKAMGVMSFPELVVTGEDGKILLRATDTKNPSADKYDIEVGETDLEFNVVFKAENMKLINGDYDVQISSKGLAKFSSKDVEYWISIESNSTF